MDKCELKFCDGKSDKFWHIELNGSSHTVRYGRTGTQGQSKTKDFPDEDKARASYEKLIAAKRKKGYNEAGDQGSSDSSEPATKPPSKKTDLADGESIEVQGSAAKPYLLRNVGGVYSCSCPAWRNQSVAIEQRTCKHLRKLRGDQAETERVGTLRPIPKSNNENAPGVLLAQSWDREQDLSGWWLSEKLDGVRAYWDGEVFLSRLGNRFYPPDWFVKTLPKEPLDGELFGGRKKFQETVSIVRRQDGSDLWKRITFEVFDAPAHEGPFEERLEHCRNLVEQVSVPHFSVLDHLLCRDTAHLLAELKRVEELGGEGLMARQPGSGYQAGRSYTLVKIKNFLDAEATVVGHQKGTGKHKGRLGSLLVELPNGIQFSVGTGLSDAQRESPPAVGAVICFRYQELSRDGVPRFPSFVGERIDAEVSP